MLFSDLYSMTMHKDNYENFRSMCFCGFGLLLWPSSQYVHSYTGMYNKLHVCTLMFTYTHTYALVHVYARELMYGYTYMDYSYIHSMGEYVQ